MTSEISGASLELLDHVADGVYMVDRARKITVWNKSAERISGFGAGEVKGSCCADGILTHVDDKGRSLCKEMCPLAYTLEDGEAREATVNLHHKDGHRVPVHVSVRPIRNEQGEIVGAVETFRECSDVIALRSAVAHLKHRDCVDVQSGLANRRIAEAQLGQRTQEMQRFGWPYAVMLVEMDFLPQLEARWGREGLVDAIRMAAASVQNSLRSLDTIARWDDATFIAIVANATMAELITIGERVRMMVDSAYKVTGDGEMHVTVSIGAAGAEAADNPETLLRKAERALYESRTSGRNRVSIYGLVPPDDAGEE